MTSLHDTASECHQFCIYIALTQSSETGITWAANTSLLKVEVSAVMIETVQPGNTSTWGNVGPSSQH